MPQFVLPACLSKVFLSLQWIIVLVFILTRNMASLEENPFQNDQRLVSKKWNEWEN